MHEPGRLGLSDFTDMGDAGITVAGQPLDHRLYHFRLAYSGFDHAYVVLGGEFRGPGRGAAERPVVAGRRPARASHRQSVGAFRNLDSEARADLTCRYEALCGHYGMTPSRNNTGVAHENGAIEGPHGHLKRAVKDALLLRGSTDFAGLADFATSSTRSSAATMPAAASASTWSEPSFSPCRTRRTADYEEVTVRM